MHKEKIIIDVDTGSDDAVALVCALLSEDIDVLGVTTVGGNVELKNTTDPHRRSYWERRRLPGR